MGRKIGKRASKRMQQLRGAVQNCRFQCHYLGKRKRKEIKNWKSSKNER